MKAFATQECAGGTWQTGFAKLHTPVKQMTLCPCPATT